MSLLLLKIHYIGWVKKKTKPFCNQLCDSAFLKLQGSCDCSSHSLLVFLNFLTQMLVLTI